MSRNLIERIESAPSWVLSVNWVVMGMNLIERIERVPVMA